METSPSWLHRELAALAAERHGDPLAGLARVEDLALEDHDDAEIVGQAIYLRALFLKEVLRWEEAEKEYERVILLAKDHDLLDLEAKARANLATLFADLGQTSKANRQMTLAKKLAPASAKGLVIYLSALLLQRRGHHHEALAAYDKALPLLEEFDDRVTIEVLHLNRGIAYIYLDDLEAARENLLAAETAATALGLTMLAAMAAHNLGFLDSRRGFLAEALIAFDRAESGYRKLAQPPKHLPIVHSDRAEVLLQVGLTTDARLSVGRAVEELQAAGTKADLIEARLLLARACLAAGDYEKAKGEALIAANQFRSARRFPWVAQASYVARQVDYQAGAGATGSDTKLSRRFEYLSKKLLHHGWPVEGRDALVFASLAALRAGETRRAEHILGRATRLRGRGAVQHRSRQHLAKALLLRAKGDQTKAMTTVRRGVRDALKVLDTTGSTEARAEALRFAGELAALGTSIALERSQPTLALRSVERQRSVAAAVSPSINRHQTNLHSALGELRTGGVGSSATAEDTVRQLALRSQSVGVEPSLDLSWRELRRATRSSSLVYYLAADERLQAIVVRGSTTNLIDLALTSTIVEQADYLQFALQRLGILGAGDERSLKALRREARQLHTLLIEPLNLKPGPVAVVGDSMLSNVLWSLLPMGEHDLSLTASGRNWMASTHQRDRPARPAVVLVSGPRLEASEHEVHQIAAAYENSTVLRGSEATVGNVLEAFAQADLVHIASHGVFRSESPMFSRLELADGPLTIYDLERLERLPPLVVLSACEAAASRLYPSGGALGTAAALTALGARTVVAPLQPIADSATKHHMVSFHQHLLQGATAAGALRLATAEAVNNDDADRISVAASFVAFGAG